jgi:hypothetical protein
MKIKPFLTRLLVAVIEGSKYRFKGPVSGVDIDSQERNRNIFDWFLHNTKPWNKE